MLRFPFTLALCVLIVTEAAGALEVDPIGVILDAARLDFRGSVDKANASLLLALGRKQQAAQQGGDLDAVQAVQAEIDDFNSHGLLPDSITTKSYQTAVESARKRMEDAFEDAIAAYTRGGQIEQASAVQEELRAFRLPSEDGRIVWKGKSSTLRLVAKDVWEEVTAGGDTFRFQEASRTSELIELRDARRGITLRLTSGKILAERDRSRGQWKVLDTGDWRQRKP